MKFKITGFIACLLFMAMLFQGSIFRANIYPKTFTLSPGMTISTRVELPEDRGLGYYHWWLNVNELKSSFTDNVSLKYCIAKGIAPGDTLAKRQDALRYALSYTGGLADELIQNFTFADSGWYCVVVDMNGVGYDYVDFVFENAGTDCCRISLYGVRP